jgi:hypothetical protein
MHALAEARLPSTAALSPEQRERFRREGRIARAVEAAQRHTDGRFSRPARDAKITSDGDGKRSSRRG